MEQTSFRSNWMSWATIPEIGGVGGAVEDVVEALVGGKSPPLPPLSVDGPVEVVVVLGPTG